MQNTPLYYSDYLELNRVLGSQHPKSFEPPHQPAHDEMLFIIIHQAFELWFKQIRFELDYVCNVFRKEKINDNSEDLNLVVHRLNRVVKILDLLNEQVGILDTMTPLDFLEFRNLLTPSSGFQSLQFRLIEAQLGLRTDQRHQAAYYKRTGEGGLTETDFENINRVEKEKSVLELVNDWLERMPFFELQYWRQFPQRFPNPNAIHPFWNDYANLYALSLSEKESGKIKDFEHLFLGQRAEEGSELNPSLSPEALKAGLFIMLYRDFPFFQNSFRILDTLIEIDHTLSTWRYKHLMMVRRMIGMRVGTGNTTGAGYLDGALQKHYVFRDLAGLNTFLIERKNLPVLPKDLINRLGFNN
jgi:tryptophan 2,3-dioxygenase